MKLYIMRHGETAWNVEGRLQGQSDTELNENGVRLAKVTAEGLKNIPFDLGISSPLRRAKHTAELVLAGRNVPLTTDDRLMELSFGSWEGLGCRANNFEIPSEHFNDFYRDPFHFRPAGDGETIQEVCDRAEAFYHELTAKPELQDKTILIATHGCCMARCCAMSMKTRTTSGTAACRTTVRSASSKYRTVFPRCLRIIKSIMIRRTA